MIEERFECKKCKEILEDKGKAENHFIKKHFNNLFEMFYEKN